VKLAVVLFNLGGPDSPDAVEPFLVNLFSDPTILSLPSLIRLPVARWIAARRAPVARAIYAKLGGRSPILSETEAQADALDQLLKARGFEAKCFIAMRCWHPFSTEAAQKVKAWGADQIVLLPLYPQFSTTTTGSSFADWSRAAASVGLLRPTARVCCFPDQQGFVAAQVRLIQQALTRMKTSTGYRLLLSAHGLPQRTIAKGDPYQWQVERSARATVDQVGMTGVEAVVCYQSRVGPLQWIGPSTESEIRRAGADGKGVIVVPFAFVSEHSETLVELDIEYAHLAAASGVADYIRVPTVGTQPDFIAALADMVLETARGRSTVSGSNGRLCPTGLSACPWGVEC
jgi:ferrochelatase